MTQLTMTTKQLFDAIIIGGSSSGMSAALALGRARRIALILDANEPCNARVPHAHNLLIHDGEPPHVLRAKARVEVANYPTVHVHDGRATGMRGSNGAFIVLTHDGQEHQGRKLVLALGVRDELPAIIGLADCWGISAAACPFCHGYEVRDKRIAIIGHSTETIDYAHLIHNWSDEDHRKVIVEMQLLIIDEVSMVRSDLLDAVDFVLQYVRRKRQPFEWCTVDDDWRPLSTCSYHAR